ncbi:MAG: hypothetical protein ABFD69_16720 [Candidatus Sumerlaeia bacterium]
MGFVQITMNLAIFTLFVAAGIRFRKKRKVAVALMAASFLIALYGWLAQARPYLLTWFFPFADVIYYSNLYPFAVGLFAPPAYALARTRAQRIRFAILLSALFYVSLMPYSYFWLPPAEVQAETKIDSEGICRQTCFDTCGAASVVTYLRMRGVSATERQAAGLALTKKNRGTLLLGQYRALKKLAGGKVRIARMSVDDLVARNEPALITVGLSHAPRNDYEDTLYRKANWTPGVMHDVVFMGVDPEDARKVIIGEPDFGVERWWVEEFKILYQGYAVIMDQK